MVSTEPESKFQFDYSGGLWKNSAIWVTLIVIIIIIKWIYLIMVYLIFKENRV